jgi:hypothetical protein
MVVSSKRYWLDGERIPQSGSPAVIKPISAIHLRMLITHIRHSGVTPFEQPSRLQDPDSFSPSAIPPSSSLVSTPNFNPLGSKSKDFGYWAQISRERRWAALRLVEGFGQR